ncbi:MFS transporter [Methanocella sp. CWC-04]|uniref:MFS transporter n=1 Tax=Methanooceanicella nereidis TaxID=2052831 RepID=A0AAP2W6P6_9EURY|nr:MFS transporter [Methanocella sp. CWC-04]MCD1295512.1 MFS transporter [Methanocella sp. CWC-04]
MKGNIFSRYDRQIWVLVIGSLINAFGFSIAYPFISLYLYGYKGIPMGSVGFALMVAAVAGALTQVVSGELCDRVGRKIMMNIGLLIQMVAFTLLGFAVISDAGYDEFLILLTLREIAGGLYRNIPQVMVADVAGPGERIGAFSLIRIGANLGFAIGPVIGGIMAMHSYSLMFFMTAVTSGIYMIISLVILRDTLPGITGKLIRLEHMSPWMDRPFIIFCAVSGLIMLVYSQMMTTFSSYSGIFANVPESQIGLLFSLNGLMIVFFQYPVARYLEHFRLTTSLAAGSSIYAIGFVIVGFCTDFRGLLFAMFIISVGELVITPPSMAIVAQMAPSDMRGRYMSVAGVLSNGGIAFGPMVGGYLMDFYSARIEMMWIILGGIAILCMAGFIFLRSRVSFEVDRPTAI